jgi:hypothetical protein
MAILTVGTDLAKNVFALHGVNGAGKPELLQPCVPRAKLIGWQGPAGKNRRGRRCLLAQFAVAECASRAAAKSDSLSSWAMAVRARRGYWKAVVAIAAKGRAHGLGGARQGGVVQAAGLTKSTRECPNRIAASELCRSTVPP